MLGDFRYRLRGRTAREPGGGTTTTVTAQVVDRYDFDPEAAAGGFLAQRGFNATETAYAFDVYGVANDYFVAGSKVSRYSDP